MDAICFSVQCNMVVWDSQKSYTALFYPPKPPCMVLERLSLSHFARYLTISHEIDEQFSLKNLHIYLLCSFRFALLLFSLQALSWCVNTFQCSLHSCVVPEKLPGIIVMIFFALLPPSPYNGKFYAPRCPRLQSTHFSLATLPRRFAQILNTPWPVRTSVSLQSSLLCLHVVQLLRSGIRCLVHCPVAV